MSIEDLRHLPADSRIEADLCIVGAGPAGLALAMQFVGTRVSVCVLETGGVEVEAEAEDFSEIESVGLRRAPQDVTRRRGLGGSSALWTGRCGVFDALDLQPRPWIAHSGWPISRADLAPYIDPAGQQLGLGPGVYSERIEELLVAPEARPAWDRRRLEAVVWQYSRHAGASQALRAFVQQGVEDAEHIGVLQHAGAPRATHFGEASAPVLAQAANVRVLLHAHAVEVLANADATAVTGVRVCTPEGVRSVVQAQQVVLCCGGIDNARLLLASRSANPRGLGNAHDVVGRYLMDHPYVELASYEGEGCELVRRRLGHRWVHRGGALHIYHFGIRLSAALQREHGLLNAAIQLQEFGDAPSVMARANGVLAALRRGELSRQVASDLLKTLSSPRKLAQGLHDRYVLRRPSLAAPSRVAVGCALEQVPDPSSRVSLSDERDALGLPRAKVDWRAADLEFESAKRLADVVIDEIRRIGGRPPVRSTFLDEGPDAYRALIHDMAHPMGTTRMADDPRHGVVDAHCAVHGVAGLHVAGSSVFATGSYMNPTLMIVALSLRLADRLKHTAFRSHA